MSVFATLVERWVPTAPAVTYEGQTTTYGQLTEQALRAATWLKDRGLREGDVVALHLEKERLFLDLHLGALASGIVTLPLHTGATAAEVRSLTEDADAALLVDDPGVAAEIAACDPMEPIAVPSRALAVLCYTSGTTGTPKGAQITHGNLLATVRALHEAWRWGQEDVLLHALPLFHIHGLFVAQHGAMYAGAHARWVRRFRVSEVLDALPGCTVFMGVPTFYARLLEAGPGGRDLSGMRLFTSGSAPLPASDHEAFEAAFGHRILERYGMTEVGIVLSNPYDGERRPGSVGFPLPGVSARVTDEAGETLGTGAVGEIRIAGASVCAGYLNRPAATEAALGDGWMHTGDLGFVDGDGYFHVVGRASDMILSGGLNVYPREIEAVLLEDGGVSEVAVFGLPDADLGERVAAAIVCTEWDPARFEAAVRAKLNPYKLPRRWIRVDALPRNAMGKVQKAALRREYSVTVRDALPDDLDHIVAWNEALCAETEDFRLDPAVIRQGVQRVLEGGVGARYFLVERGGRPVGQLMITTEWSDWRNRDVWWIQSVYIAPADRRHGVYRTLHDYVERCARRAGAAGLRLYVEVDNHIAMKTYARVGMSGEHYRMYEKMFSEET